MASQTIKYKGSNNRSLLWCVTTIITKDNSSFTPATSPGRLENISLIESKTENCGCSVPKTSYPNLPFLNPCPDQHPTLFSDMAFLLKTKLPDNESLARAIFSIIWSESTRDGYEAKTGKFIDAGGYNFSGVQTDTGIWGGGASDYISGRYTRKDSQRCREFASFNSLNDYINFMINRAKAKGFDGFNANKWTKTYICNWWNPSQCPKAVPGNEVFETKKSWYEAAIKRWSALKVYSTPTPDKFSNSPSSQPTNSTEPFTSPYQNPDGTWRFNPSKTPPTPLSSPSNQSPTGSIIL